MKTHKMPFSRVRYDRLVLG